MDKPGVLLLDYGSVNNQRQDIQKLLEAVHQAEGPVLADEFMGLVVLDGRQLFFQPFEFKQLATAKVWDETQFLQDIKDQKFGMILLYAPRAWDSRHERWTQAQLTAIDTYYYLTDIFAEHIFWCPGHSKSISNLIHSRVRRSILCDAK